MLPALYLVGAAAWIVAADAVARAVFSAPADLVRWSTLEGLVFVLYSGLALYALLRVGGNRRTEVEGALASAHSPEALRALAAHVQAVREEEKARIARDLHDELGQRLTVLQLDIEWVTRRVRERADPTALLDRTAALSDRVQELAVAVRRIAAELRPPVLDQLGLGAALRREAREFELRTGIACETTIPDELPALAQGAEIALYRIAQEALTNVVRHARATSTCVALASDADGVTLSIVDDGRGIHLDEVRPRALGIVGMKERAAAFGGEVRIGRGARGGTAVLARVPRTSARVQPGAT